MTYMADGAFKTNCHLFHCMFCVVFVFYSLFSWVFFFRVLVSFILTTQQQKWRYFAGSNTSLDVCLQEFSRTAAHLVPDLTTSSEKNPPHNAWNRQFQQFCSHTRQWNNTQDFVHLSCEKIGENRHFLFKKMICCSCFVQLIDSRVVIKAAVHSCLCYFWLDCSSTSTRFTLVWLLIFPDDWMIRTWTQHAESCLLLLYQVLVCVTLCFRLLVVLLLVFLLVLVVLV